MIISCLNSKGNVVYLNLINYLNIRGHVVFTIYINGHYLNIKGNAVSLGIYKSCGFIRYL